MRFQESLGYLNSFLNLEQTLSHPANFRWNLERMRFLVKTFAHPEENFFPVLIAGTKGKGSTGFFLESILKASHVRVGFYSSPHLEDPRERIRINGALISKASWCKGLDGIRRILGKYPLPPGLGELTYFEMMTLLAMLSFKKAGVRVGIFEIGMGGRFDATNVMDAQLAILTPVYLDHEAFLGNTIAKIAREKAAIIRPGAYVVVSPQKREANIEILKEIHKKNARALRVLPLKGYEVGLAGEYQRVNAGAALGAAQVLEKNFGYNVTAAGIKQGLAAKAWPGRFEILKGSPDFLLDGAHNPSSIEALVGHLRKTFPLREKVLIFGTSRDKRSELMLRTLGTFFPEIILTPIPSFRSQEIGPLLSQARGNFRLIFAATDIKEALSLARKRAGPKGLVVGTGSFYLIGRMRKLLKKGRRNAL